MILRLDQFSSHIGERLLHLLALADVLDKDENPTGDPVETPPGTNLPAEPRGTVRTIPAVFLAPQCFSSDTTPMHLFPPVGKVRRNFIMRAPQYLRTLNRVVCTPAIAHLEVAHVTVEHRDSRRRVLDEDFQKLFA